MTVFRCRFASKLHLGRAEIVIASEAKQSRGTEGALRLLDRRVASLLAKTIPTIRSLL
jgi:hypothetical protein